jgi:hypothetical protein
MRIMVKGTAESSLASRVSRKSFSARVSQQTLSCYYHSVFSLCAKTARWTGAPDFVAGRCHAAEGRVEVGC